MINIAVFASGSGSNAENIYKHFENSTLAQVSLIVSNNEKAFVLQRAANLGIEAIVVNRSQWTAPETLINELKSRNIDLIVLAGFLWLVPEQLISAFPDRIINIHPALLPKYGGKGMYGDKVHEAVKQNRETETGITIHYVNSRYDEGTTIFQESTGIDPETHSVDEIAQKVHALEYEWYPKVIEDVVSEMKERE
jgi:phosphoribosylglycinamide formyltransferase-1